MMKRTEATFAIPRCWTWLVLPALLLSLGCGGPKGDISGSVTYLDKPLQAGTVTFFGSENRVVGSSVISSAGTYSVVKVPAGPVTITVTAPITIIRDTNAPKLPPPSTGKKGEKQKELIKRSREQKRPTTRLVVPEKYSIPEQSGLTYTVQPGSQEHNIDLK